MTAMTLKLNINLSFNGECEAAFKFYERCLNGRITYMLTWGDSPMANGAPTEWGTKINHATIEVGNTVLQGSDPAPGSFVAPQGFCIMLQLNESDGARVFTSLSDGGTIGVPYQKTFWAAGFGMVTDRFGIPWAVNAE
jgi:PhnB protein